MAGPGGATVELILTAENKKFLADLDRVGRRWAKEQKKFRAQAQATNKILANQTRTINAIRSSVVALGAALGIRQVVEYADTWQQAENLLKTVSKTTEDLVRIQERVVRTAIDTRTSFEGTVQLYSRLARSTRDLGLNEEELFEITETVNKSIALSGATAQEARNGIIQFAQGLASSRLAGDELRAVLEQLPRLAIAIADGMGVGLGELRELGKQGAITTEVLVDALQKTAPQIAQEFESFVPTVEQTLVQIETSLIEKIGEPLSKILPSATKALGDEFQSFLDTVTSAEQVWAGFGQVGINAINAIISALNTIKGLIVGIDSAILAIKIGWEGLTDTAKDSESPFSKLNRLLEQRLQVQRTINTLPQIKEALLKSPTGANAIKGVELNATKARERMLELNREIARLGYSPELVALGDRFTALQDKLLLLSQRMENVTDPKESFALLDEINKVNTSLGETREQIQAIAGEDFFQGQQTEAGKAFAQLEKNRKTLAEIAQTTLDYGRGGRKTEALIDQMKRQGAATGLAALAADELEAALKKTATEAQVGALVNDWDNLKQQIVEAGKAAGDGKLTGLNTTVLPKMRQQLEAIGRTDLAELLDSSVAKLAEFGAETESLNALSLNTLLGSLAQVEQQLRTGLDPRVAGERIFGAQEAARKALADLELRVRDDLRSAFEVFPATALQRIRAVQEQASSLGQTLERIEAPDVELNLGDLAALQLQLQALGLDDVAAEVAALQQQIDTLNVPEDLVLPTLEVPVDTRPLEAADEAVAQLAVRLRRVSADGIDLNLSSLEALQAQLQSLGLGDVAREVAALGEQLGDLAIPEGLALPVLEARVDTSGVAAADQAVDALAQKLRAFVVPELEVEAVETGITLTGLDEAEAGLNSLTEQIEGVGEAEITLPVVAPEVDTAALDAAAGTVGELARQLRGIESPDLQLDLSSLEALQAQLRELGLDEAAAKVASLDGLLDDLSIPEDLVLPTLEGRVEITGLAESRTLVEALGGSLSELPEEVRIALEAQAKVTGTEQIAEIESRAVSLKAALLELPESQRIAIEAMGLDEVATTLGSLEMPERAAEARELAEALTDISMPDLTLADLVERDQSRATEIVRRAAYERAAIQTDAAEIAAVALAEARTKPVKFDREKAFVENYVKALKELNGELKETASLSLANELADARIDVEKAYGAELIATRSAIDKELRRLAISGAEEESQTLLDLQEELLQQEADLARRRAELDALEKGEPVNFDEEQFILDRRLAIWEEHYGDLEELRKKFVEDGGVAVAGDEASLNAALDSQRKLVLNNLQEQADQERAIRIQAAKTLNEDRQTAALEAQEFARQAAAAELAEEYRIKRERILQTTAEEDERRRALNDLRLEQIRAQGERENAIFADVMAERRRLENDTNVKSSVTATVNAAKVGTVWGKTYDGIIAAITEYGKVNEKVGKAVFIYQQALAIADTIMQTYANAVKAYGWGVARGGPAAGAAAAAAAIAYGLAQVAVIAATTLGTLNQGDSGGGGGSGGAAAVGAEQEVPEREGVASVQVIIEGNILGDNEETKQWLVDTLNEAVEERDVVVISGTSRNGIELS